MVRLGANSEVARPFEDHAPTGCVSSALVPNEDELMAVGELKEAMAREGVVFIKLEDKFLLDPEKTDPKDEDNKSWFRFCESASKQMASYLRDGAFTPIRSYTKPR